jgi:hypothetical protein
MVAGTIIWDKRQQDALKDAENSSGRNRSRDSRKRPEKPFSKMTGDEYLSHLVANGM